MLKYEEASYGISAAYDKQHGGTGAQASFYGGASAIAMTSSSDWDSRATVNAFLRLGNARIGTGWLGRKVRTTASEVSQNTEWLQAEIRDPAAVERRCRLLPCLESRPGPTREPLCLAHDLPLRRAVERLCHGRLHRQRCRLGLRRVRRRFGHVPGGGERPAGQHGRPCATASDSTQRPITAREREIAETIAPLLWQRGLLIVGLDVIGEHLTGISMPPPDLHGRDRKADRLFGPRKKSSRHWTPELSVVA